MISGPHAATFRIERPTDAAGALLWRCPSNRMPIGARLCVMPDECAVFMSHGRVLGSLGPGTYGISPRDQRFLEPAIDIASDARELACDVFLIAIGEYSGVELSGSLGKLRDDAGEDVPLWFRALLKLRAVDPERLATALDAERGDPMEAVRFVAIRALRRVVEHLARRGELVPSTVSRGGAAVKKAALSEGLGLDALGVELVGIDHLELTRQPPSAPLTPGGSVGVPQGTPSGQAGQAGFPPAAPAMAPPGGQLVFTIPGVPHLDAAHQILAHVGFQAAFVGEPVPPQLAQWVVDRVGDALFTAARSFSGSVLEVPMHAAALSAMLNEQLAPLLAQAGLRGHVVITAIDLPPADPGILELMRRAGHLR